MPTAVLLFASFAAIIAPPVLAQTAILGNIKAAYVLPSVNFPRGECPATLPTTKVANSDGLAHGVGFYGTDFALVSYFGEKKVRNIRLSTATTLNTIDTTTVGYAGGGTIAVSPTLTHALAAEGTGLCVIAAPFSSPTVSRQTLPSSVGSAQTQAIVFNAAGRAFVLHSFGVSVLDPPYTSIAFTMSNQLFGFGAALAITPDGQQLLTTNLSNRIVVINAPFSTTASSSSFLINGAQYLDGIAVTPDGQRALVVDAGRPGSLQVVTAPFGGTSAAEEVSLGTAVGTFEDVGISADGQYALLTGNDLYGGNLIAVRAPFTGASATVCSFPIEGGRGAGAVRFLPPALQPPLPPAVVGIDVWPKTLVTTETGSKANFSVVLSTQPTANVLVTIAGVNATEGSLSATSMTFTPANWQVAQVITVTGVDDNLRDGDVTYNLSLSSSSADASYHNLALQPV